MANNIYEQYLEERVLSADSAALVGMLYDALIEAVAAAREDLRTGDIPQRSRRINKALGIVNHLMLSLDHNQGGELSRNLVELYAYISKLLVTANTHQSEPPLSEAVQLLATLREGWHAAMKPSELAPDDAGVLSEPVSYSY